MPIENRNLEPGTRLRASYKKETYVCTVEAGEEEGSFVFLLEGGSRHKSPSAAASKVMDGKAVNGWRFWTVEGDEPAPAPETEKPKQARSKKRKQAKTFFKTPTQGGAPEGQTHYSCSACMKAFDHEGTDEPDEGHRNDDPELNAPSGVTSAEEAEVTA